MNIRDQYGNYFSAEDIRKKGGTVCLVIANVIVEDVGGEEKPVMYFQNLDKGLPLNKTNGELVADEYGDETKEWEGEKIVAYLEKTKYQGKTVDGVRLRAPRKGDDFGADSGAEIPD